jgi:hypothetical protein
MGLLFFVGTFVRYSQIACIILLTFCSFWALPLSQGSLRRSGDEAAWNL